MKLFISVDAEGLSGITSWHETLPDDSAYPRFQKLMTREVNIVCESILGKYPDAVIYVCDSHARCENILPGDLDSRVYLVKGFPRPFYMMEGLDDSFDGVIFLGYHSRVGSEKGGMDHTYSSGSIYNIRINGKLMSETHINAILAGYYKVPLILVSGDDVYIKEIESDFPGVEKVITRTGISRFSSISHPPDQVYKQLRIKALSAVDKIEQSKIYYLGPPYQIELEFISTIQADVISILPEFRRVGGRGIEFTCNDYTDFYRYLMVIVLLASTTKTMG